MHVKGVEDNTDNLGSQYMNERHTVTGKKCIDKRS